MHFDQSREVVSNHLSSKQSITEIAVNIPLGATEGDGIHPGEELLELVVREAAHDMKMAGLSPLWCGGRVGGRRRREGGR